MEDDGYVPTMRLTKTEIKVTDAGAWASGANWGFRLTTQAINIAGDLGMYIDTELYQAMRCYNTYDPCPDADGDGYCDHAGIVQDQGGGYDEAEAWLNERAPDGYAFACWEGDFGMWEVCPHTGEWDAECSERHCENDTHRERAAL